METKLNDYSIISYIEQVIPKPFDFISLNYLFKGFFFMIYPTWFFVHWLQDLGTYNSFKFNLYIKNYNEHS